MNMKLYDKTNINDLNWSEFKNGNMYKSYLTPFIKHGVSTFIKNVDTTFLILAVDDLLLPLTINEKEYDNSYVCSPYTHYCTYAEEETNVITNKFLKNISSILIKSISSIFKYCEINKTVIVNNWLVSTNLHIHLSKKQIDNITIFLTNQYPNHSIMFRSINNFRENELFDNFKQSDYKLVVSRQIYFYDYHMEKDFKQTTKNDLKRDRSLFKKNGYTSEKVENTNDESHLLELYNSLYIDKYSLLNPHYTEEFIKLALETKFMNFHVLKKENKTNGFIAYFNNGEMMTTPLIGYDTSFPIKEGLYRMLSMMIIDAGKSLDFLIHQSSGAAGFKRQRGAIPEIEFNAIYTKHLSFKRKVVWNVLKVLLNNIGIYLLKKYKL